MSDTPPPAALLPQTASTPRVRRVGSLVVRLVVTAGPSIGKTLIVDRDRATVGRHPTNDLVLADPRVSAAHLEIERIDEERVLARDLGTTNGTWLGTHRLVEVELGRGALLSLGHSALRLDIELDDRAAPELGGELGHDARADSPGAHQEGDAFDLAGTFAEAKGRAVERFEAAYLEALLRRCAGNLSKASRQADVARNHLRALLKKRGLYGAGDP